MNTGADSRAATPIHTCAWPAYRIGCAMRWLRRRTHRPPKARPRMKALSISSKLCRVVPRAWLSRRTQTISYTNEVAPVMQAAASAIRAMRRTGAGVAAARAAVMGEASAADAAGVASHQASAATSRFRTAATVMAPGMPIVGSSRKVATSAPSAAPTLLLKYRPPKACPSWPGAMRR